MSVEIRGDREIKSMLKNVEAFLKSTKPIKGIVEDVERGVEEKTEAGKDYRGRRFVPYSAPYAKKKGTTKVDLRKSGLMMGSLKTEVLNPKHGRVKIQPVRYKKGKAKTDMISQIHTTGTGKQPQREFMNITKSALAKLVKKHYDDEIMRILGRR